MKTIRTYLLVFLSALAMAPGASLAQSSGTVPTTAPISLGVEFHPGETLRYTFSLKMNLTAQVDPSFPKDKVASLNPRQYELEGEIDTTFASTQPGEPLRANVRFQGLQVKNWVSSAQVGELEERLHRLEATPTVLAATADGNFEPTQMPAFPPQDPYLLDIEDVDSVAQALLIPRIATQPLAPGQHSESAHFPIPGMVKPGMKLSVLTEYLANVPIAGRPSAEVRLTMNVPNQSHAVSTQPNVSQMLERWYGAGVWTYLLDLDAHQISFLHKTIRTESGYRVESTDSNATVRIPKNLFTVNAQFQATARRVAEGAPAERDADLAALEKTLPTAPPAATEGAGATGAANPGAGLSLGEVARRLRAERAAQTPPQPETTLPGGSATGEGAPPGSKAVTFPSGDMTVFVPAEASEEQRTSEGVKLRAHLGTPPTLVMFDLREVPAPHAGSPDALWDEVVKDYTTSQVLQLLHSEKTSINGKPALVLESLNAQGKSFHALQAYVLSGDKAFLMTCGALPVDYPKVESLCRTVANSIRGK